MYCSEQLIVMERASLIFFFLAHFRHADFKIKTMHICPHSNCWLNLVNACFPVGDFENVHCAFNELHCLL